MPCSSRHPPTGSTPSPLPTSPGRSWPRSPRARSTTASARPPRRPSPGTPYLVFETEAELGAEDLALLGNLSSGFALYELLDGDLLRPLATPGARPVRRRPHHDPEVLRQDQRALHPAAAQRDRAGQRRGRPHATRTFTVLDPVAGRGTTLNQALMYGWNGLGIEVDSKDVDAYAAFLKTGCARSGSSTPPTSPRYAGRAASWAAASMSSSPRPAAA